MAESDVIDIRDLPESIQNQHAAAPIEANEPQSIDHLVRVHAQRVLEQVNGNKVRAAEILGISRTYLYQLLKNDGKESERPDEQTQK